MNFWCPFSKFLIHVCFISIYLELRFKDKIVGDPTICLVLKRKKCPIVTAKSVMSIFLCRIHFGLLYRFFFSFFLPLCFLCFCWCWWGMGLFGPFLGCKMSKGKTEDRETGRRLSSESYLIIILFFVTPVSTSTIVVTFILNKRGVETSLLRGKGCWELLKLR